MIQTKSTIAMNCLHIFQVAAKCILLLTLRYSSLTVVVEILRSIDLKSFNWKLLQQWFICLDWYGCKTFMPSNPLKLVQSANIIFTLYIEILTLKALGIQSIYSWHMHTDDSNSISNWTHCALINW